MSKNKIINNNDKKYILKILESIAAMGIIYNTMILMMIRETWTYEKKVSYWDFGPTPKSSYITVIQYNPALGIVYFICGIVLLSCGISRLVNHIKDRKKKEGTKYNDSKSKEIDFLFLELPFAGIGIICSLCNIYKPVFESTVKACFFIVLLLVFIENTIIIIKEHKKKKNNN